MGKTQNRGALGEGALGWHIPFNISKSKEFKNAVKHAIAQREKGKEMCGYFLTASGNFSRWIPVDNIHPEPSRHFRFPKLAQVETMARIKAGYTVTITHSHLRVRDRTFSSDDSRLAENSCYKLLLLHGKSFKKMTYFDRMNACVSNYEGRPWHPQLSDCFSLVRDYLSRERAIALESQILKTAHDSGYKSHGIIDLRDEIDYTGVVNLCKKALHEVRNWRKTLGRSRDQSTPESFQKGDILVFHPSPSFPVHLGVLDEPESGKFYHQLAGAASACDVLTAAHRHEIAGVFRAGGDL